MILRGRLRRKGLEKRQQAGGGTNLIGQEDQRQPRLEKTGGNLRREAFFIFEHRCKALEGVREKIFEEMLFASAQGVSQDKGASMKEGLDETGTDRGEIPAAFFSNDEDGWALRDGRDSPQGAEGS